MKIMKFLFISGGATASSVIGFFVGLGLMTYLNLFTYKLSFDALTLLFIMAMFMFVGLKLMRVVNSLKNW